MVNFTFLYCSFQTQPSGAFIPNHDRIACWQLTFPDFVAPVLQLVCRNSEILYIFLEPCTYIQQKKQAKRGRS